MTISATPSALKSPWEGLTLLLLFARERGVDTGVAGQDLGQHVGFQVADDFVRGHGPRIDIRRDVEHPSPVDAPYGRETAAEVGAARE